MFTCVQCKQKCPEKTRVFEGPDPWCRGCYDAESKRSVREDMVGDYIRSRPPKYMFPPSQWPAWEARQFG